MNQKEFFESLKWIDGPPPSEYGSASRPVALVFHKDDKPEIWGNSNLAGGGCECCSYHEIKEAIRHAFLWERQL